MIIKNLWEYRYFNSFKKYIFMIMGIRISPLKVIIKNLILYIGKILLYIMRIITIISTMYMRIEI